MFSTYSHSFCFAYLLVRPFRTMFSALLNERDNTHLYGNASYVPMYWSIDVHFSQRLSDLHDDALLRLARCGCREARDVLVGRFLKEACLYAGGYARLLRLPLEEVEDVQQDSLFWLIEAIGRFIPAHTTGNRSPFRPFLYALL